MPRPAPFVPVPTGERLSTGLSKLLAGGLLPPNPRSNEGRIRSGLDFASLNALGLVSPPHAAQPPAAPHLALEQRIAAELRLPFASTFASRTNAIRHVFGSLLQPGDEVLIDAAADPTMFQAILTARANLHRFPPASIEGVERRLCRLARQPHRGRLVIAAPAVSAFGSRISDLVELCALARQHAAIMIVDVSQDFAVMGARGGGQLEIQNCLGRVDVVLGCFSRCFGLAGGFAAFRDPSLRQATHQAPPLSPTAASTVLAATDIAFGLHASTLRRTLQGLSLRLRNRLIGDGARVLGSASPFVPVLLPALTALPRTALLESAGPRVTLLMPPDVPMLAPRWRIELNARHTLSDIDDLAELIRDVSRAFDRQPSRARVPA